MFGGYIAQKNAPLRQPSARSENGKKGIPWENFGKTNKKEDKTVLKKAEKTIDKISVMG